MTVTLVTIPAATRAALADFWSADIDERLAAFNSWTATREDWDELDAFVGDARGLLDSLRDRYPLEVGDSYDLFAPTTNLVRLVYRAHAEWRETLEDGADRDMPDSELVTWFQRVAYAEAVLAQLDEIEVSA